MTVLDLDYFQGKKLEQENKDKISPYIYVYIGIVTLLMLVYKNRGGLVSQFDLGEAEPVEWNEVFQHIAEILFYGAVLTGLVWFITKIGTPSNKKD
jgi:hypothetical protein